MPVLGVNEEQARALASGEYGRASLEQIAFYGVPFFFVRHGPISAGSSDVAQSLISNGTAFIVDLGEGPFGVTAHHVIEKALSPEVGTVGLFPKRFKKPAVPLVEMPAFGDRIIDGNSDRDIATFRVTGDEVARLGVSTLTTQPSMPTEGAGGIGFIGYPGTQRDIVSIHRGQEGPEMTLSWAVFPGFGVAASVSDRQITFQFDRSELTDPPSGFSPPDPNLNVGGMSGGPLLKKCETSSGIEYWAPAGVITQGELREDLNGGFLFASRLDGLQKDGSL